LISDHLCLKPIATFRRRCLVPASGFYEWKNVAGRKDPYFIRATERGDVCLRGIVGVLASDGVDPILSFTIITCEPNEMLAELHNRMPVILPRERHDAWVDPANQDTGTLQTMLAPYPADEMSAYPVHPRVDVVGNDDKQLVNPLQNLSIYVSNG
jgi:putative SOS response-associated peptidase YedK